MDVWTITYNGAEQTATAWGLNAQPVIRTRDRSPTKFSFRMAGFAPEGAVPFPYQAQVVIKHYAAYNPVAGTWSGAPLFTFTGYQTTQKGRVDGRSQGVTLDFQDAIWLLQNTTFQQNWVVPNTTPMQLVPESRVILFMDVDQFLLAPWSTMSVQWEINEIITYAQSCGIAIAAGTIDYGGWYLNYYHARAITCWEALLKCLEMLPDAKMWVDGSTNPPQLNVRTRANLAALAAPATTAPGPITLPFRGKDAAGRSHFSTDLTPRYDLVPPQVVLQYQINNTINGKPAPTFTNDVYPAGSNGQEPFALVCPIDLTGATITTATATLDCEPLACIGGTHAQKRAWWTSKRGGEQDKITDFRVRFQNTSQQFVAIGDATIVDDYGNAINPAAYPQRIVAGAYHSWMKNGATQINAIRAHIRVQVQMIEYDVAGSTPAETDTNGNIVHKYSTHEFHAHVTLTNSPAGTTTYSTLGGTAVSEQPVAGLAQNVYNSRATLDYDGAHEIVDPGILGQTAPLAQIIGHWNVLNISGGNAAWANANMTIAGTEIDLFKNHIRIDIGPSKHLSPQDWTQMLIFFRNRRCFIGADVRATGYGAAGQTIDLEHNTPDANTVPGLVVSASHVVMKYTTDSDPTTPLLGRINHDAGDLPTIDALNP
jgi:hypothetical protein